MKKIISLILLIMFIGLANASIIFYTPTEFNGEEGAFDFPENINDSSLSTYASFEGLDYGIAYFNYSYGNYFNVSSSSVTCKLLFDQYNCFETFGSPIWTLLSDDMACGQIPIVDRNMSYSLNHNDTFKKVMFKINMTYDTAEGTTPRIYGCWLDLSGQGFLENSQTYNTNTIEGSNELFTINFTFDSSNYDLSYVSLIYNNTSYSTPYSISGNNVLATKQIIVPKVDAATNISFYWNVTFTDGNSYYTSQINQTVTNLNVDDCSSYTVLLYNFTNYDEETREKLTNSTMEFTFNIYDISKTNLILNYSKKFTTNQARICTDLNLTSNNYSSYVYVKYYSNDSSSNKTYATEYYNILNQTINNATIPKQINLYDLDETDTTVFRLTFRDSDYALAPNILVNVYREYLDEGTFKVVEIPLTDSNGQAILNLVKNSVIYNLVMTDEGGNIIATFNRVVAFCQDYTIGECTIKLNAPAEDASLYDYDETFNLQFSEAVYSNSTGLISIGFVTNDLLPKTVSIQVTRNNAFGNRSVCTDSVTSASATLNCDVSSITATDQFLFIHVYVDGQLAKIDTINLNADTLRFGKLNGTFYSFLLILLVICLFMDDRQILVVSLGIGYFLCIGLGLINGKLFGFGSAGIWLVITIIIYLWKLNKEENL